MNENISDEINLMDYFQVLRKRKWLIILGTLLCMVVAGVVSLTKPKVYEAKIYLMVTLPKYQVEFATKEGSKISTPIFQNITAETFSKIVLNEHTAKAVLDKLALDNPAHKYTVNGLLGQVKVEYPRNTNLILLKVQDTSKDRAAQIANAWASAFIERNDEVVSKETTDTFNFVVGQLEKVKISLKTAEEELERFQKASKIELLREQISGKIKQIVQYESRLDDAVRSQLIEEARYDELITQIMTDMKLKISELEVNLEKQRIVLDQTNAEMQKENKYIPVDKGLIGKEEINPLYVSLNSKRADTTINISMLEKEKDELLREQQVLEREIQKMREDSRIQKREKSSLKKGQSQLAETSDTGRQRVVGYTNVTYKALKDALMKSEVDIQSFNAEILQLKKNLKNLNEEVSGLKKQLAEQELIQTRLTRNMETAKSTFEILSKKGEETRVSSSIKAGTIQVSVPATTPEFPIGPNKRQNVMIAGVVGLLASIMLAFFIEFLEKNKAVFGKPA
jgi:polysaccharide biosynthesis transport protein